ncbi:MAG: type II toxin-antitoxin system PemK/MazF family toxin [Tetrasphaera sp.]
MRGEVYRLPTRGKGHEQKGRRYAVVLTPDWLTVSTWIVAFTSTRAHPTSFRPAVMIDGRETLVMCDQLATVDLVRLSERAGALTLDEMRRVDEALTLVLDL